ncbi:spore gernimation protein [Bacillus sp. VT 712]|uniref:spore germination protein GerPB n=1 Tax=Bacillaceae TaxID=186817 RepID=UPI000473916B|nr:MULTISPECIES: spore germination protein GerPB [Bacillaceae]KZB90288.1 spore gernimation protein [Bacillus sp. VT 712]MEC0664988.1 spore germination protein GerPB [Priestia flexa]MED3824012.1 spore germination protein GerPB [Priestia flexa]
MNFYVNQSICIQSLKVSAVSNSSVLQIGSAGIIKPNSNLFNTGGFTGPAPDEQKKGILGSVSPSTFTPTQSSAAPAPYSQSLTPPVRPNN